VDEEILVDARGHRCPVPTLKLARVLGAAPAGALVRLLTDDPIARVDVPHFAGQTGIQILAIEAADEGLSILVRKPDP
jgi:tRNA 2-thiouridine synthesizing protein A